MLSSEWRLLERFRRVGRGWDIACWHFNWRETHMYTAIPPPQMTIDILVACVCVCVCVCVRVCVHVCVCVCVATISQGIISTSPWTSWRLLSWSNVLVICNRCVALAPFFFFFFFFFFFLVFACVRDGLCACTAEVLAHLCVWVCGCGCVGVR